MPAECTVHSRHSKSVCESEMLTEVVHHNRERIEASLVGSWWGIHLSIQETQVPSLGRFHMLGATKHVCHNYRACVLKSRSHDY